MRIRADYAQLAEKAPGESSKRDAVGDKERGLVLDDYFGAIGDVRKQFSLPVPVFSLQNIESYPSAKAAINAIVRSTILRHGKSIFTKAHPLLSDLGDRIYSGRVATPPYKGRRIRAERRDDVLRRAIEVGVQTITQLPSRYFVRPSPQKRLKSLSNVWMKAERLANEVMRQETVRRRIELYFESDEEGRRRLLRGIEELKWCAETLDAVSKLKVKTLRLDSPNPQVSLALYIANWFESATGNKKYGELSTVIDASFSAAKRTAPRWVERLPIEMHARRRRREEWMKRISTG